MAVAVETTILYEFNLTCGHLAEVRVDAVTMEPLNPETGEPDVWTNSATGRVHVTYTCPLCGIEETP